MKDFTVMEIACAHACGGFSEERDRCTLFVKNLPSTVSVKDIKALSKDIREVRLRIMVRAKNRQKKKLRYVARACVEVGDEIDGGCNIQRTVCIRARERTSFPRLLRTRESDVLRQENKGSLVAEPTSDQIFIALCRTTKHYRTLQQVGRMTG